MLMHGGSAWGGAEAPYLSSETDSQEDEMLQVDEVWDSDEGEDGGSDQGEEAKGGVEEGQDADGVGTEIFGAKTGRGSGGGGVGGEASAEEIGERSDRSRRVPREVPAPKNAPPANAQVGVHEKAARRPRDEEGPSLAGAKRARIEEWVEGGFQDAPANKALDDKCQAQLEEQRQLFEALWDQREAEHRAELEAQKQRLGEDHWAELQALEQDHLAELEQRQDAHKAEMEAHSPGADHPTACLVVFSGDHEVELQELEQELEAELTLNRKAELEAELKAQRMHLGEHHWSERHELKQDHATELHAAALREEAVRDQLKTTKDELQRVGGELLTTKAELHEGEQGHAAELHQREEEYKAELEAEVQTEKAAGTAKLNECEAECTEKLEAAKIEAAKLTEQVGETHTAQLLQLLAVLHQITETSRVLQAEVARLKTTPALPLQRQGLFTSPCGARNLQKAFSLC